MVRSWLFRLMVILAVLAACSVSMAQSGTSPTSSGASGSTSGLSNTPVGEGIASSIETFSQGVPELREAQELRSTQDRGSFVGSESDEGPGFIGAAEAGGSQTGGASSRRTTGTSRRTTQTRQTSGPTVRPALVVGFAYAPKVSPSIDAKVRTCLGRLPDFGKTSSIRVRVEQNVVVLEGVVANKHDAALALQMVALEPGVVKIDNRLTVAKQPTGSSVEGQ
ncbi:MAG: BON domain-containing protein [Pirellulales bacterium]|nr:BON domain-containing protein [Pirellulales bacterium]